MRKVLVILIAVICSVDVWGQTLSVVNIGNNILEKNSFAAAKQIFKQNGLVLNPDYFSKSPETHASSMLGEDKYSSLLAAIDVFSKTDKRIKQVTFLIGEYYQERVVDDLKRLGYKYTGNVEMVTLGNGVRVPQVTYIKGTKQCVIQEIDDGVFQNIIFKNKTSITSKK